MSTEPLVCRSCGKPLQLDAQRCSNCGLTTPLGEATTGREPAIAGVCTAIGIISIVLGVIMLLFAISQSGSSSTGAASFIATAITLVLSSIFWFAIAKVIKLLALIAHNTSKR
jgi:hypothetical protein